jgi:hypothetical protein
MKYDDLINVLEKRIEEEKSKLKLMEELKM